MNVNGADSHDQAVVPPPTMQSLLDIATSCAAGEISSELLHQFAGQTRDVLKSDIVFIRSVSPDTHNFIVQAAAGHGTLPVNGMLGSYNSITGALRNTPPGQAVTIDLVQESVEPVLTANEGWAFRQLGAKQLLIIPLFASGELAGRIDVTRINNDPFEPDVTTAAVLIGSHIAQALRVQQMEQSSEEGHVFRTVLGLHQSVEHLADPHTILQAVVELVLREPGCSRCYAMLWDGDREEFVPTAVAGLGSELVEMLKLITLSPQVVPAFDQMMHSSHPLVIPDAPNSTLLPKSLVHALGIRSAMIVPLRGQHHQTIGFLLLDQQDTDVGFTQRQIAVMEGMAHHLSTMIENAMLYEDAVSSSDSLAIINEIGIQLAMLTDETSLFRQLHHQIAAVIDASYFALGLLTSDRRQIEIREATGGQYWSKTVPYVPGSTLLTRTIHLGNGSLNGTRDSNDPLQWAVNIDDIERAHSQMTVPITVGRNVIGAMSVQSPFRHAYGPKEMTLFSAIALHTGVAIENARLYRMVQERGARRAAVLDEFIQRHELERKELVDEIHNNTLQTLAACLYGLDRAQDLVHLPEKVENLEGQLSNVREHLSENIDRLRKRIFELRPATLDVLGLEPALKELLTSLNDEHEIETQLDIELPSRLAADQETAVYRIIQEAMYHIQAVGEATSVSTTVRGDEDGVAVTIQDNGSPYGQHIEADIESGEQMDVGMLALIERAELAGGEVRVAKMTGRGTSLHITLPGSDAQEIDTDCDGGSQATGQADQTSDYQTSSRHQSHVRRLP